MDEFLILLQAKLDEAKSKGNINDDIVNKLQGNLKELEISAKLDQKAVQKLANDIGKLVNQKIVISNIEFDSAKIAKEAQQAGKQVADSFNQSTKYMSLDKEINNQVNSLMESFGVSGKKAFVEIKNALIEYRQELAGTTSSTKEFNDIFDIFANNSSSIDKVTSAIANNLKVVNDAKDVYKSLNEYISQTNKSGSKIYIPNSIKSKYGEDFNRMRSMLGQAFTNDAKYKSSLDFENFITELNGQLGNVIDLSHGAEAAFGDLVEKVKSAKGSSYLSAKDLFEMGYLNKSEMISQIDSCIDAINQKEKSLAQESDAAANQVVQNEIRKQRAIQDTEKIQEQLVKNGNIIQQTDFATSFDTKEQAEKYFNTLSKIVSIQGKLGKNKNLESFIVEVKNAEGAVEKLTYKYNELTGAFEYSGGSINNNGIQKQIDAINIKASRLQDTFESLKSKYSDLNASNPIKEQSHITELENQYKKVEQAIKSVKASDSATFSSMVSNAESEIKALQRMGEEFKRAETISMHMNGSDISSGLAQAQERFQKLKINSTGFEQMTETIQKLDAAIAAVGDKSSLKAFVNQLKVAESQLERVKAETKAITQANKIQLSIETGGYESKVDSLIARTRQWTDANGNARISTDNLSSAFDKLLSASNAFSDNKTIANQQALIKAENELNIEIEKVTNSVRKRNAEFAKDATISSLHNQIQKFYDNNGAAHRKWGTQLKQMLSETASGAELTKERVAEIKTAFNGVASAAQQAGKIGKTWFQSFKDAAKFLTYWTSPTFITMKTIAEIKQGINTVKELDTALVDLKKTTTMTGSELENFYYDSNKVAKQMGVTTEEIINQAAEFSRLGYSSKQAATEMAKYSSWFKTISPGMSIEKAGDTLTSVMKAFKYDVQDVEKIMSMINTVGNNFAVSNADISEILTRSSSAMMEANNSLADTIALGTAA